LQATPPPYLGAKVLLPKGLERVSPPV
jgi:hypothetical protein